MILVKRKLVISNLRNIFSNSWAIRVYLDPENIGMFLKRRTIQQFKILTIHLKRKPKESKYQLITLQNQLHRKSDK